MAKLQLTIDEAPICVAMVGTDKRFLECNKSFCDFLGYSNEEMKGKTIAEITFPEDMEVGMADLRAILAGEKKTSRVQKRYVRKDGGVVWGEVTISLIRDEHGHPIYLLPIIQDITERKRLEDELLASEKQSRLILDSTPFPTALVDIEDNNIEYWSRSALELFGHTAPTTTEWYQLAYPDPGYRQEVIGRWKPFLETARLSGKPVNAGEYRVTCHDGTERLCELYATFQTGKLIVTFHDITERKKLLDAINKNMRFTQATLDAFPANIAVIDDTGVIISVNQAWRDFAEANPPVLSAVNEGVNYLSVCDSASDAGSQEAAEAANGIREVIAGTRIVFELEYPCHSPEINRWFLCRVIRYFESNLPRILLVHIDITIRKLAEEKIKENASLLHIAGEKVKLGGWSVDLKNNLCTWSDETAAIHERPAGYSPLVEEGISYYPPEWREKITKAFTQCAQNGIRYDEEMEIITANGNRVWVRTIGEPVKDEAGKIVKVQGAFQEITERKQTEEQLLRKVNELERWQTITLEREERIAELKKEVNDLLKESGKPGKYETLS